MDKKIANYMRVTKKRKTSEKEKGGALYKPPCPPTTTQPPRAPAPVPAKKPSPTSTSLEPQHHHQYYRDEDHVPEFIYKVIKYVRRGQGEVSKDELAVVKYIERHYRISADFERDHKFGPHSGLTFEKRLMRAYSLKLLKPKDPTIAPEAICITCTHLSHSQRDCPDGF